MTFLTGSCRIPVLGAPPSIEINFKHNCVNGCRCFPTVSTCSLYIRVTNPYPKWRGNVIRVFNSISYRHWLWTVLIILLNQTCVDKLCIQIFPFLQQCNGLFLKVAHGFLRDHIDQYEKLFFSLCFITVSEKRSHWRNLSKALHLTNY